MVQIQAVELDSPNVEMRGILFWSALSENVQTVQTVKYG